MNSNSKKIVKPRSGLSAKTSECFSCKKERPIWKKDSENKQCFCKECATRIAGKKAKTTKPAKKKVVPISKLKTELDLIYSQYIRLRDSDHSGYSQCITCGKLEFYKQIQCGHFLSRRHFSTRWEPKNTHSQCKACNMFNQGLQWNHSKYIEKRYGAGTCELLHEQSQQTFKLDRVWLEDQIQHYKLEVQRLKTEKGLN